MLKEYSNRSFKSSSLEDTKKIAEFFSQFAERGKCFALYGDLGYGKTTFVRYFIKSLNPSISEIISPTFTISQTYESQIGEIWHVDCYRLQSKNDFFEIGLEEACNEHITIIEWPEIIEELLPKNLIKIYFSVDSNDNNLRYISTE